MGLAFSYSDAHWSYSGFNRFRNNLVVALGYPISLDDMYETNTYGQLSRQGIYPLINHSDCDGYLTVNEMIEMENECRKENK